MKGFTCDIAIDGAEAVRVCKDKIYDLIFMDCQMPVMDGYEATQKIRASEGNERHTPIIAMTAYAMAGDAAKCKAAGMDDYLSKPVDVNQLMTIIQQYAVRIEDRETNDFYDTIVKRLMDEIGFEQDEATELLREGMKPLNDKLTETAMFAEENNFEDAYRALHQLKGGAGNLRIREIAEPVKQAELAAKAANKEELRKMITVLKTTLDQVFAE